MNFGKQLVNIIRQSANSGPKPYDTKATVRRVDGNTLWVHIPGGVDETPVQKTVNAKPGDTVQVRVGGGRAWLVGNASAPPTDDTTALIAGETADVAMKRAKKAQGTADAAQKIAGNTNQYFWHTESGTDTGAHITEKTQEAFLADPTNGGGNLLARSNGIAVRDGLTELATFSANGASFSDGSQTLLSIMARSGSPSIQFRTDGSWMTGDASRIFLCGNQTRAFVDIDGRSSDPCINLYTSGFVGLPYDADTNWTWLKLGLSTTFELFAGFYQKSETLTIGTAVGNMYSTSSTVSIAIPKNLNILYANVNVSNSSYAAWAALSSFTESTPGVVSGINFRVLSALSRTSASYPVKALVVGTIAS